MIKVFLFFVSMSLYAAPFVSREHIEDWHNKVSRPYTSYGTMRECLANHSECFDLKGRNLNETNLMMKEVDDKTRPIYAEPTNVTDCKLYEEYLDPKSKMPREDDCRLLIAVNEKLEPILCSDKSFGAYYDYKRNWPPLFPLAPADELFAYCTKIISYHKKIVEVFERDNKLAAALEAERIAREKAQAERKKEKEGALTHIREKKGIVETLTPRELSELIEKILILLGE